MKLLGLDEALRFCTTAPPGRCIGHEWKGRPHVLCSTEPGEPLAHFSVVANRRDLAALNEIEAEAKRRDLFAERFTTNVMQETHHLLVRWPR